jgi:hypothetical protein
MVVSDNDSELTSNAILTRAHRSHVEWHYIAPGKPSAERLQKASRQLPSLSSANSANPAARANLKLDKTWGQGQQR